MAFENLKKCDTGRPKAYGCLPIPKTKHVDFDRCAFLNDCNRSSAILLTFKNQFLSVLFSHNVILL